MRYELMSDVPEPRGWEVYDSRTWSFFWIDARTRDHAQAWVGIHNLIDRIREKRDRDLEAAKQALLARLAETE